MISVTCDKTGIQFEAESKRQKNHPRVSALLNEAAKDKYSTGAYNAALSAFAEVKAAGGYTIDGAITCARAAMAGNADAIHQKRQATAERERQMEQARRDAKSKRDAQNAHLRAHGYTWSKTYANFDEYEEGEPSQWVLFAFDGVAVDVTQALDEIARGATVVRAEMAAKEAEAAAKVEAAKVESERLAQAWQDAEVDAIAGMTVVEAFDYAGFDMIREYNRSSHYLTMFDRLYTGAIDGVACAVVYSYVGGHDYSEYISFYCVDPGTAGLTPIDPPATGSLEDTLANFFGAV